MRTLRKILFVLVAIVALVAALVVDERLKRAPEIGFCPADATWRITFSDFPRFWNAFESSGPFRALEQEWPSPLREVEVAVRKSTGIRPTYARWRLWLGHSLLAAGKGESAVFCVRPGLLLRAAHAFRPLLSVEHDGDLFRYNELWYTWRDGYLIFSSDRGCVAGALASTAPLPRESLAKYEARVEWLSEPQLSMKVSAGDTWSVEGTVKRPITRNEGDLAIHRAWANAPMLAITAWDMPAALAFLAPLTDHVADLPDWTGVPAALKRIDTVLRPSLIGAKPCSIAVDGFNRDEEPPVLVWGALTARLSADSSSATTVESASGRPESRPVLNGSYDLTVEPLTPVDDIVREPLPSAPANADIAITINWRKLSDAVEKTLRAGNEKGAFESLPKDELERYWIPMVRGLGALLELSLEAKAEGDGTSFSGYLASPK